MHSPGPLTHLSDIDLLELLCSSENDEIFYDQFVNRFYDDLQKECERICSARKLDAHIGRQIANDTFERVRKYKSFKKDRVKRLADRLSVNVYLNRIALRLFNDHYRKEKAKEISHKTYFDDILEAAETNADINTLKNKKDIAASIFKKLNPKEQQVVLADIEHKKHQKYLPDDVTETLAGQLNVETGTIRKIRQRAITKITTAINEINKQ